MQTRVFVVVAGLLLGIAIGLVAGWVVWPVEYADVTPDLLDERYQFDYAMLIAQAYSADKDLELARARFDRLGPAGPVALYAVIAAERDDAATLDALQELAAILEIDQPAAAPPATE